MLHELEQEQRQVERNIREFRQFGLTLEHSETPFKVENYSHYPFKVTFLDGGCLYLDAVAVTAMSIGLNLGEAKHRQDEILRDFKKPALP